jgi:AcrR family transcriptional regulator
VVEAAMRLFGEQGYAATTVAEIESAAGLSPGSGGLYRHFRSKRALLEAGVREQVEAGQDLVDFIDDPASFAALPLRTQLATLAAAGLRRLRQERDLNRLLTRDLARFPDLLAEMRDGEINRVYQAVTRWLAARAGPADAGRDWPALAAVLIGTISHYWLLCDVFGRHPAGIDEERYLAAFADVAAGLFDPGTPETTKEQT